MKKENVIYATKKTNPGPEEWLKLGRPKVYIKVKSLPDKSVVYEEVAYGGLILKKANGRKVYGMDMIKTGKILILGPYYTSGKVEIYWKNQA